MTSCEEPYIGEESISRPPSWKKARMTSAQELRAGDVVADVERDPAAEPDERQLLAARGDRPRQDRPGMRGGGLGDERPRFSGRRADAAPTAPSDARKARRLIVSLCRIGVRPPLPVSSNVPVRRAIPEVS